MLHCGQIGDTGRLRPPASSKRKDISMIRLIPALVIALAAVPAFAAGVKLDASSEAAIRDKMKADGYEVRRVDTEDGYFEVYAMKDGHKYEMYLDDKYNVVKSVQD